MRTLSFIISISIAISVIHAASLAAARNSYEQQAVDIHPVSYGGLKKRSSLVKRDYATTLQYLRAAMASYRKDAVTPPSAEFVQLEQSLAPSPPPPATEAQPVVAADAPPPAAVDPVWAVVTEPMPAPPNQQVMEPPVAPEQADPPQHLDAAEPLLPDWDATPPPSPPSPLSPAPDAPNPEEEAPSVPEPPKQEVSATPELGNESTEKTIPIHADIEEDDTFDPEEDPDDVDDPPIVNASTASSSLSTHKKARLSRRDIPDPNTMVKLAQSGLRNMMVVAKLTADNELNLLQPKKPKVNPADADNSEFGVSAANPNAGKQQKTPATSASIPAHA
ncbi:hypothetical protein MBANPS3_007639 [Mucor bainieri]